MFLTLRFFRFQFISIFTDGILHEDPGSRFQMSSHIISGSLCMMCEQEGIRTICKNNNEKTESELLISESSENGNNVIGRTENLNAVENHLSITAVEIEKLKDSGISSGSVVESVEVAYSLGCKSCDSFCHPYCIPPLLKVRAVLTFL